MSDNEEYDDRPQLIQYTSSDNINFRGYVDTGYTITDWKHLPQDKRDRTYEDIVWELVEFNDVDPDDPDENYDELVEDYT